MDFRRTEREISEQEKILLEFRRNLSDVLKPEHTDSYLLKWLRAKNFEIKKSEEMLRLHLSYRDLYQIDKLHEDYEVPEVAASYGMVTFLGFDKEGCPVRLVDFGKGDFDGYIRTLSTIQIGLYGVYIIEGDLRALEKENKRTGKSNDKLVYIIDMEKFNLYKCLQKHVIETALDLLKILQDGYPDLFKSLIVINAPIYFYVIFNIIKPSFNRPLLENVVVFSKDSWPQYLKNHIDAEYLPEILGGTSSTYVHSGGLIPTEMYGENQKHLEEADPGVKTTLIAARSTFNVCRVVTKPKSRIFLEFHSENHSINVSIYYRALDPENNANFELDDKEISDEELSKFTMISPESRVQSSIAPIREYLHCKNPGIYAIHFDNSRSVLRQKKIVYRTTVNETLTN